MSTQITYLKRKQLDPVEAMRKVSMMIMLMKLVMVIIQAKNQKRMIRLLVMKSQLVMIVFQNHPKQRRENPKQRRGRKKYGSGLIKTLMIQVNCLPMFLFRKEM